MAAIHNTKVSPLPKRAGCLRFVPFLEQLCGLCAAVLLPAGRGITDAAVLYRAFLRPATAGLPDLTPPMLLKLKLLTIVQMGSESKVGGVLQQRDTCILIPSLLDKR